ncbi:MAG: hypothetical protein JOZ41_19245 [Chloroflexi bacterium]|nr:hypothetical protein [Chloroflexota bacterium]
MNDDQNWYRQLLALVLVSAARGAVEFIINPRARDQATNQLRDTFQSIDYDAVASALTRAIDDLANASKDRLSGTIDTLRERGHDAVDEARSRAQNQLGQKKGGRKVRFVLGIVFGALVAYFLLDEQRRDDLLDRLTGASGPIQPSAQSVYQQAASSAQQAADATKRAADQT